MISTEQIVSTVREKKIETIRLQFVDVQGIVKNISIPPNQLGKALKSGISFDGSSIEGFARIQ